MAHEQVMRWKPLVDREAARWGLPSTLVLAVMAYESGGNPTARSPAGACGLMQVMPFHFRAGQNCYDPATNIAVGTAYLADRRRACGSDDGAIIGYFSGQCRDTGARDALGTSQSGYLARVRSLWAHLAGSDATRSDPGIDTGAGRMRDAAAIRAECERRCRDIGAVPNPPPGRIGVSPDEGQSRCIRDCVAAGGARESGGIIDDVLIDPATAAIDALLRPLRDVLALWPRLLAIIVGLTVIIGGILLLSNT